MSLPRPTLHTYFDEDAGERIFYSCEQLAFDIDGDELVVVPPLFLSDGLSIPRLFRSIFSKSPSYIYAGIAHDWCYRILPHSMTRKQADKLFLKLMRGYGVGFWTRALASSDRLLSCCKKVELGISAMSPLPSKPMRLSAVPVDAESSVFPRVKQLANLRANHLICMLSLSKPWFSSVFAGSEPVSCSETGWSSAGVRNTSIATVSA